MIAYDHQRPLSREPYYANIFDRQLPIPRPANAVPDRALTSLLTGPLVLDDRGPRPGSVIGGGTARADAVSGSAQLAAAGGGTARLAEHAAFVPSAIPVRGEPLFGLPGRTTVQTAQGVGTHLYLERNIKTTVAPTIRVATQIAGFARADGESRGAVPHLYAQVADLIAGQSDTFFSDPQAFPNTIDYAGPNALVYLQHVMIGYLFEVSAWDGPPLILGFSLEQPEASVTPPDPAAPVNTFTSRSQFPDVCVQARLADKPWGHVQVASILRGLGIENDQYRTGTGATAVVHPAAHDEVLGWGVQCTGMVHPFDRWEWVADDRVGFGAMVGRGLAEYNQDLRRFSGLDAAFDGAGRLRAIPLSSFFVSYMHLWTPNLWSTVVHSQVDLDSFELADLKTSPYRRGRYFAANLVYEWEIKPDPVPGGGSKPRWAFTGIEYLYGRKELLNGSSGDAHRVQVTAGARY